ncbi:MAG: energy transducer TonB [Gammaproteobacteria bacterium]|nr:energy transducer TonB [Gammaproteobacteria bacterium]
MTNSSFCIKPYHWWIVISLAVIFHASLLISYDQDKQHINTDTIINHDEIVIRLKKLNMPAKADPVVVIESEQLKPIPPVKPVQKKPKIIKPEKTIVDKKPIVKPKVVKPKIEAFAEKYKQTTIKKKSTSKNYAAPTDSVVKLSEKIERDRASYLARLSQWLERHKKYPSIARRRGQEGQAVVKFTINSSGQLVRHQLVKPSEHQSLNTAAIKMLERASPMPVPPSSVIGDKNELTYTIPVNFSLVQ